MKDQTSPRRRCSQAWSVMVPLSIGAPGKGSRSHRPGHHTAEASPVALAPFLSAYRINGGRAAATLPRERFRRHGA